MHRFISHFLALLVAVPLTAAEPNHAFFENRVRPILVKHCYECHSEKAGKRKGDLLLDRPSGWLEGGQSGPAVVPGNIEESLLSFVISHEDPLFAMPEEKLSDGEINVLNRWIQMGAPGPKKAIAESEFSRLGDQEFLGEKAKTHWSFQPVVRPDLPELASEDPENPVDAFVLRKLRAKGLEMAPPADRRTLLRRLSYDLTGLPPTMEEIEEFIGDDDPRAYLKQVDRLLDSPRFGERWGRYWLDIARYADTREWQAAGRDSRYPFAYTYRDYVIRSFNEDLPYNQFLKEQIAADFYAAGEDDPSLAALGFLTVGSRFRGDQDEIANDRIDAVTRGIMGLTVSCARCHDHKYDPIPTTDYYALHGVFRSVSDIDDYPIIETDRDIDPKLAAEYQKKREAALQAKVDYSIKLARDAREEFASRPQEYLRAIYDMSIARSATVQKLITGNKFQETVLTPIGSKIQRVPIEKHYERNPFWRPLALLVKVPEKQFPRTFADFLETESPTTSKGGRIDPAVWAALGKKPLPGNARELMARYGEMIARALQKPEDPSMENALAVVRDEEGECFIRPEEALDATRVSGKGRRIIADFENKVRDLDAEHPGAPPRAMIVEEASLWNARVYERGDRARRGEEVPRRFLTALGGETFSEKNSGRRGLAEEIASPENPFTTRTAANWVWRHLMGKSLIPSPDDMGLQSEPPSHPELLDYLAAQFVEDGWSIKKAVRRIVLSQTYRQGTQFDPKAAEVDPDNTLYWRRDLRRLDFEAMRDSLLAAAGYLDLTMGGRAVEITAPPYTNRRTVYAHIDRVNLDDIFATFDFPSPTQSNPERTETTVPQQALYGMNDGFVISQARLLASQLGEIREGNVRQARIAYLFHQVLQRDPSPEELNLASAYIDQAREEVKSPLDSGWRYGYGVPDPAVSAEERFTPFPFFDRSRQEQGYRFSRAFPHQKMKFLSLSATGGHTGHSAEQSPVRRWIAPYEGTFRIHSDLEHRSDKGDGVRLRVISSRQGLIAEQTAFDETKQLQLDAVELTKGEILDFVVDLRETPVSDSFRHTVAIDRSAEKQYGEPGYAAPIGVITNWDSQADFAGPPPPPLTGWEQLAHGLLMTNEFLFLN